MGNPGPQVVEQSVPRSIIGPVPSLLNACSSPEETRVLPTTRPELLMPFAVLIGSNCDAAKLPRFMRPLAQRNAYSFPAESSDEPTTCACSLIPRAILQQPPRVPRSVIEALSHF